MTDQQKLTKNNKVRVETIVCAFSTDDQPSLVKDVSDEFESPHDFEQAVEATGYGLFNYLIILANLPRELTNFFDTTATSYILPSAECDLQLTLFQKGMLNATIFAGMIASACVWGFSADMKGRRPLLMIGYSADFICNVLSSMSQSFEVMMAFKFLSGCFMSGPFVINMAYVIEFHGTKHRSQILLWTHLFSECASVLLPGLAWLIIPQPWKFTLFNGTFVYNSWRIFILVCSIPPLLSFLGLFYLPESPRFLMSQGRNDEALKVFQRMYVVNTGEPLETFEVKQLCQEGLKVQMQRSASGRGTSVWDKARIGWSIIKPLFRKPYLYQFLLITIIQLGSILSLSTLRLWMPQLFTLMENFDYENRDPSLGSPTLCDMISASNPVNTTVNTYLNSTTISTCVIAPIQSKVYINSIIVAVTQVIGYTIAASLINLLGAKKLLLIVYAAAAACSLYLSWSPNSDVTLAIIALYMAFTGITRTVILSVFFQLMPTSLRATATTLTVTVGRVGALTGNLLLPILLTAGCMAPFIFVGGLLLGRLEHIQTLTHRSKRRLSLVQLETLKFFIGKKNLSLTVFAIPIACVVALQWTPNSTVTLAIMAVYVALTSISTTNTVTFVVDLMPTSLRTMAVSLTISIGRGGAMLGNVLFPILLSVGCNGPFIFIGGFLIACFLMTIFIPKPPTKLL